MKNSAGHNGRQPGARQESFDFVKNLTVSRARRPTNRKNNAGPMGETQRSETPQASFDFAGKSG